jgi:hypothetical protein
VLLSHLVLFGFIYPGERASCRWLLDELIDGLRRRPAAAASDSRVCAGTLLSREQYLHDVECSGLTDARITPLSTMTPADIDDWTRAIPARAKPPDTQLPMPPV